MKDAWELASKNLAASSITCSTFARSSGSSLGAPANQLAALDVGRVALVVGVDVDARHLDVRLVVVDEALIDARLERLVAAVALGATLYSPATRPRLADDVLKQAAHDLRRFRTATKGVKRDWPRVPASPPVP